jgi:hypothetical protein
MERKTVIWIGVAIGSTIGGSLPMLWGGSLFSFSSVILTGIGGIIGIWAGFRLGS